MFFNFMIQMGLRVMLYRITPPTPVLLQPFSLWDMLPL